MFNHTPGKIITQIILLPFHFSNRIKKEENKLNRIFSNCLSNNFLNYFLSRDMSDIILTKVALLAIDEQTSSDDKTTILRYKDKNWILLDAYKNDVEHIMDFIELCKTLKKYTITIIILTYIFEF